MEDGKKRKEIEDIEEKGDKSPDRWMEKDHLKGVPDNLHNGSNKCPFIAVFHLSPWKLTNTGEWYERATSRF